MSGLQPTCDSRPRMCFSCSLSPPRCLAMMSTLQQSRGRGAGTAGHHSPQDTEFGDSPVPYSVAQALGVGLGSLRPPWVPESGVLWSFHSPQTWYTVCLRTPCMRDGCWAPSREMAGPPHPLAGRAGRHSPGGTWRDSGRAGLHSETPEQRGFQVCWPLSPECRAGEALGEPCLGSGQVLGPKTQSHPAPLSQPQFPPFILSSTRQHGSPR